MRILCGLFLLLLAYAWPAPARAEVIHQEKSLYREIFVVEENGQRCLRFRRSVGTARQSCYDLKHPDYLVLPYAKLMLASLYLNPNPKHVLIIGLGGGTLPMTLKALVPDAVIDVVEIDPAVVRVAKTYFSFKPDANMTVAEEDGRVFVRRARGRGASYDLIMLDAFGDDYIPEHMLTREFFSELKEILAPNGVFAANTFSSSRLYDLESATYNSVFGTFYNLRDSNRIVIAVRGDLVPKQTIIANAEAWTQPFIRFDTDPQWALKLMSMELDWDPNARVLTDQYSPSNLLNAR